MSFLIKRYRCALFFRGWSFQLILSWRPFVSPFSGRTLFERIHLGPFELRRFDESQWKYIVKTVTQEGDGV